MAQYITKEDYLHHSGKNLDIEFKNGNFDVDNPADVFLTRVEEQTIQYIKMHYQQAYDFDTLINLDLATFKKGLLYQVDYILENGEVSLDSESLVERLGRPSFDCFRSLGLCNTSTVVYYG